MKRDKRGTHPHSLANLEKGKFKPGQSGNPKGRLPKEFCITSILQEKLNEPCEKDPSKTWGEYIATKALELAAENPTYFKELLDRVEGKVMQPVQQEVTARMEQFNIIVRSDEARQLVERVLAGERTEALPTAE